MLEIENHCKINKIRILNEGKKIFDTTEQTIIREQFKEKIAVTGKTKTVTTKMSGKALRKYGHTIGSTDGGKRLVIVPITDSRALSQNSQTLEKDANIEFDEKGGWARIVDKRAGPLGISQWYKIENKNRITSLKNLNSYKRIPSYKGTFNKEITSKDVYAHYLGRVDQTLENIRANEIPVMKTDAGQIVCIKLEKDVSHVGIIGKTGSGKTLFAHALLDRLYWTTGRKIAVMNDGVNQCYAWGFPQDEPIFLPSLDITKAKPRPLPVVVFAPNSQTLGKLPLEDKQTFRLLLSWNWLVENYKTFFQSKPEWKLDKSEKFLGDIREELMACKHPEEVYSIIRANDQTEGGDIPHQSATKLVSIFREIFDAQFVDISTTHGSGEWNFRTANEEFEAQPFVGIMRVGGVPVFNTVDLKLKHYYPQYVKFMMDQIMKYQQSLPLNKQEPIHLLFDELTDIYRIGKGRTIAGNKLIETITQGRNHNVGAIYTTQEYLGIEESIRANTGYFFCLIQSSSENRNKIVKDFGLSKATATAMGLLEKFECIAISNDREFVVYDSDGNRESQIYGAIKGKILPPLSRHRPPGGSIQQRDEEEDDETIKEDKEV